MAEAAEWMDQLYNTPSVVQWETFNEGEPYGQDTVGRHAFELTAARVRGPRASPKY